MAWYPVYRIPDAPLTARFLTFHSLALQQLPPLPLETVPGAAAAEPRQWFAPVQGAHPTPAHEQQAAHLSIHASASCRLTQTTFDPLVQKVSCTSVSLAVAEGCGGGESKQGVLPCAGLMWDNMQNERWFERLPDTTGGGPPPEAPTCRLQRHLTDWEVRF